jgi:hypothetical protein
MQGSTPLILIMGGIFLFAGAASSVTSIPHGTGDSEGTTAGIDSKGASTVQTPGPLGAAPPGPFGTALANAAIAFVGTSTDGLRGAPGSVACMASVQYLVQEVTGHDLGAGPLANDVDAGLQIGLNDGHIVEISRADSEPGDIEAVFSLDDPNEQHIGVCTTANCTENLSNSSSTMQFGWQSSDFQEGGGGPYDSPPHAIQLRFFRVVS